VSATLGRAVADAVENAINEYGAAHGCRPLVWTQRGYTVEGRLPVGSTPEATATELALWAEVPLRATPEATATQLALWAQVLLLDPAQKGPQHTLYQGTVDGLYITLRGVPSTPPAVG
jgi:hypothetical protein